MSYKLAEEKCLNEEAGLSGWWENVTTGNSVVLRSKYWNSSQISKQFEVLAKTINYNKGGFCRTMPVVSSKCVTFDEVDTILYGYNMAVQNRKLPEYNRDEAPQFIASIEKATFDTIKGFTLDEVKTVLYEAYFAVKRHDLDPAVMFPVSYKTREQLLKDYKTANSPLGIDIEEPVKTVLAPLTNTWNTLSYLLPITLVGAAGIGLAFLYNYGKSITPGK